MEMRKNFGILFFSALILLAWSEVNKYRVGTMIIENIPPIPIHLIRKLNSYQNVRSALFNDWLPDNAGMLISTRFGNVVQIHAVAMPKGMRRQLTFFEDPVAGGSVCPDTNSPFFIMSKDSAGNELYQYYKFNYLTGEYAMLTDGKSRFGSFAWSTKGDRFALTSTARNGKDYDFYIGDLRGPESLERFMPRQGMWSTIEWSPDDQWLLVNNYISANETYYYILKIADRTLEPINPVEQKIYYGHARWSKNGKGIYFFSDQFGEFRYLQYYDLASKHLDILTKQIPWDVEEFDLTPSGNTIAFITNEDGISHLYFLNTKTKTINQVKLPAGQLFSLKFKSDGRALAFCLNRARTQSDVYTLELTTKQLIRWTYSENAFLDTTSFAEPELIRYVTFDSIDGNPRLIPAYIYRPVNSRDPCPVLIDCHGGPEGQYIPYFSPILQYYVKELGIAVIYPNIRGSTGYGKTYLTLDNGYRREDAIKDIGRLLDWIEKQPGLDYKRVAISGGSYGGFMALASMVRYSDRLCCGIDGWGISNFITFLKSTAEYRKDLRRVEYGDERDPDMYRFLENVSPLNSAGKIKKPMFIAQGLNDPRVPVSEAEQIVDAVRKNDVDVWYLLAEDEGHGFGKKENRDYYNQAVIMFLEKYLVNKSEQ